MPDGKQDDDKESFHTLVHFEIPDMMPGMVKHNSSKTNTYDKSPMKLSQKLSNLNVNQIAFHDTFGAAPMTCVNRQRSQIIKYDSMMKIQNAYEVLIRPNNQCHNFDKIGSNIYNDRSASEAIKSSNGCGSQDEYFQFSDHQRLP